MKRPMSATFELEEWQLVADELLPQHLQGDRVLEKHERAELLHNFSDPLTAPV